jgi:hypothetical protein
MYPIIGIRHMCCYCDFDVCDECNDVYTHCHKLVKLDHETPNTKYSFSAIAIKYNDNYPGSWARRAGINS